MRVSMRCRRQTMSNGKLPKIERDAVTGGLTRSSAIAWCRFIGEELMWQGDIGDHWLALADSIAKSPAPRSLQSKTLERLIEGYTS